MLDKAKSLQDDFIRYGLFVTLLCVIKVTMHKVNRHLRSEGECNHYSAIK